MPSQSKRGAHLALFMIPILSLLAGCGGGADYPSLARRPAELLGAGGQALPRCPHATEACSPATGLAGTEPPARVSGSAPVVESQGTPAVTPANLNRGNLDRGSLRDRLAALSAEVQATHATFMARRPAAEAAAGAAADSPPGSESWAGATTLLSELQSAHGANMAALAEIDAMTVMDRIDHAGDDAAAATSRADAEVIRATSEAIAALTDEEAKAIDSIRSKLHQ